MSREEASHNILNTVDDIRNLGSDYFNRVMDEEDDTVVIELCRALIERMGHLTADLHMHTLKWEAACAHDWIDISNETVKDIALCPACGAVANSEDVDLTTLTLDELREKYPSFPWKT